jgi:hypothetical protein
MTKLLVSCALAAMTLAAAPQALKAADTDGLCPRQNATLRGTYVSHGTGTIVGVGPVSAVGTITYDGKGNSSNTFTVSLNGAISRGVTVTGPYTVNPDCTGSLAQSDSTHYDFVVAPDGSRFDWIETDGGTVISGTGVRLQPAAAEDARRAGSMHMVPAQAPFGGAKSENVKATVRPKRLQTRIDPSKPSQKRSNPIV